MPILTTEPLLQPQVASLAFEGQGSTSSAGGVPSAAQNPPLPTGDSEDQAESKVNPWETCLDYAKKHVKGEIELWKGEIDSLLIFASLFSAVVGAFAIESYHSIQQDPADTTVLLLKSLLALQLNATNPQPNIHIDLDPQAPITSAARRINIYNFLSLILSLSVVMGGILCLQWLREYGRDPNGISASLREHLGIRFMRRDGMERWRVFTILRALPLILLLSLLLFFVGIIELLREVDKAASIATSIVIGISALFMVVTTTLPTLQALGIRPFSNYSQCPYKSSQAWIFYLIAAPPIYWFNHALSKFTRQFLRKNPSDTSVQAQGWSEYDWLVYIRQPRAISNIGLGLHWLGNVYLQETRFAKALYNCIQDRSLHEMLRGILTTKDPRRAASVERAIRWSPPLVSNAEEVYNDHVADVTMFQTLAHLAGWIERDDSTTVLVKKRLLSFVKIYQQRPDQDIDCPRIDTLDPKDITAHATRKDLLYYINRLMEDHMDVNESHLSALGDILELECDMPYPDLQLFESTQQVLQGWMEYKDWDTDEELGNSKTRLEAQARVRVLRLRNRIDILRRLTVSRQHII